MADKPANWDELKERLHTHWPALNEKELDATGGDRMGIIALLEGRLGYAHANAERDYDQLMMGSGPIAPHDVADADSHTGTSGPVGAVSDDARSSVAAEMASERAPMRGEAGPVGARAGEEYAGGEQGEALGDTESGIPPQPEREERSAELIAKSQEMKEEKGGEEGIQPDPSRVTGMPQERHDGEEQLRRAS